MPDSPSTAQNANPQPQKASTTANQTEGEQKLDPATWALLTTGAAILDAVQIAIDGMLVGLVANFLINIVVGLSLAKLFYDKDMLDWKLGVSLILAFASDFLTLGIMPSWTLDIGYAWIISDGAKKLGNGAEKIAKTVSHK